jgi:hypothetical protein
VNERGYGDFGQFRKGEEQPSFIKGFNIKINLVMFGLIFLPFI